MTSPSVSASDVAARLSWALHRLAVANQEVDLMLSSRLGLGASEYLALKHLMLATEPMGPVALGRVLGISSGSATALVDRLQASGHVLRRAHPDDRRRQVVTASPASLSSLTAELEPIAQEIAALAADFTVEQQETIVRFLNATADRHRAAARRGTHQ